MTMWDVAEQPPDDQFGYWREVICQAFVPLVATRTVDRPGFPARVETRPLGAVNRARIYSQPQLTDHGAREVARSGDDFYFVNLQLGGRCRAQQGSEDSILEPGQLVVLDTTEPYHLAFDAEWQMLSYRIPHARISSRLPDAHRGIGTCIDGSTGTGRAVASLMESLWEIDKVDAAGRAELGEALAAVVAVAMGASAEPTDTPLRDANRAAILRHVVAHLGDDRLSVGSVCREFAISPRYLHSLFEDTDRTFAATVRGLRLERCARLIAEPSCNLSITQIGARHGFADPASFSRAFRREFGTSPSEVRAVARATEPGLEAATVCARSAQSSRTR